MVKEKKGDVVDARCRDLTGLATAARARENPGSVSLCEWHEVCLFRWRVGSVDIMP